MVSHLARTYKKNINPFYITKLDLFTINHFQFPDVQKTAMTKGGKLDVNFNRNFIETQLQSSGAQAIFFPKLREDDRRVNVPPMLLIFCNLIEMMRLRELLILDMSESKVLSEVFDALKDMANKSGFK
jgi:hypothetical protein